VPTGVALRDVRAQLFDAAERVLLRDGPHALTSRAVTTEAGVAKGVLHRHFADFDAFLAELVLDRVERVGRQSAALLESAGTGTVTGNLAAALTEQFGSVAAKIVSLLIFRDDLRARLREMIPSRIPVATEVAQMVASYLAAERDLGRIAAGADIDALALALIGTAHLQAVDQEGQPDPEAVRTMVATVLAGALKDRDTAV
jgi:AcrR family transcriptional regulator